MKLGGSITKPFSLLKVVRMGALLGRGATARTGLGNELGTSASDGFSVAKLFLPENNEGEFGSSPSSSDLMASATADRERSSLLVLSGELAVAVL